MNRTDGNIVEPFPPLHMRIVQLTPLSWQLGDYLESGGNSSR